MRAIQMLTDQQGVAASRNATRRSAADRTKLIGGTLPHIYKW
jgi:hypothetical protein